MDKESRKFREQVCICCGDVHNKYKFCSSKCRRKYNLENKNTKAYNPRDIDAIILGRKPGNLSDQGYGFVFSAKVDDWVVGQKLKELKKERAKHNPTKQNIANENQLTTK